MEQASPPSAMKNFIEDPPLSSHKNSTEVPFVGSTPQVKDSSEDKLEGSEEILEWVPTGSDVDVPSEERESTITPPHVLVSGVGSFIPGISDPHISSHLEGDSHRSLHPDLSFHHLDSTPITPPHLNLSAYPMECDIKMIGFEKGTSSGQRKVSKVSEKKGKAIAKGIQSQKVTKVTVEPKKKIRKSGEKSDNPKKRSKKSEALDKSVNPKKSKKSDNPKKKSKKSDAEESVEEEEETQANAEIDNSLNLFNFLYDNSGDCDLENSMVEDFDVFFKMFNPDIDIDELVQQGSEYLEPFFDEFINLVSDQNVNVSGTHYIHLTSIGSKNSRSRRAIARRIQLLPSSATLVLEACPFHKGTCRVVEKHAAFLCYLSSLGNTEEEKVLRDEFHFDRTPTQKKEEEDIEIEKIRLTEEEKKRIRFISIKELQRINDDALMVDSDVPLPALPMFRILEKEYVLLHDIQVLFNLREDYCLALLAQQKEEEEDWVLEDPKLECLNTCFDPEAARQLCFDEALQYKADAPTDAEFMNTQRLVGDPRRQQLLLEHQYMEDQTTNKSLIIEEPEDVPPPSIREKGETFINLWKDGLLEDDENSQLYVEIDEFLGRRGGLRKTKGSVTMDSSLMNYIKALPKSGMHIIHAKYSNDAYMKILAFKTLSRFLGGYHIKNSVNKIILLEKNMAIDIFGFAPGGTQVAGQDTF